MKNSGTVNLADADKANNLGTEIADVEKVDTQSIEDTAGKANNEIKKIGKNFNNYN